MRSRQKGAMSSRAWPHDTVDGHLVSGLAADRLESVAEGAVLAELAPDDRNVLCQLDARDSSWKLRPKNL